VIRKSTRRIAVLLAVSDVAATWVALATAYFLRFRAEIVPITKGIPEGSADESALVLARFNPGTCTMGGAPCSEDDDCGMLTGIC